MSFESLATLCSRPWHVFVDTSPDTDADFEVAATFDTEPTQDDVNYAIVECLEGSEKEDEIVAQQMQAALEAGKYLFPLAEWEKPTPRMRLRRTVGSPIG